jgi:hypothetical protein
MSQGTKGLERINPLRRWLPLFFALATFILAVSAWKGPVSVSYLLRACLIGVSLSVLTIAYWRWESTPPSRLVWSALSVVLVIGGFYWSKDQTFGMSGIGIEPWSQACQFFAMVFATFFAWLFVVKPKL